MLIFMLFSFSYFTQPAHAQSAGQCTQTTDCATGESCSNGQCIVDTFGLNDVGENSNLASQDIRVTIGKIIQVVFGLIGVVLFVIIVYAGFTIMTAGGNSEKVETGKKLISNAVIGLIIMMSAMGITQFIISSLAGATGSNGTGKNITSNTNATGNNNGGKFFSSATLGGIITDTYPRSGDTDVKRNTKIAITFAEAIDPSSVVENTNNTCWNTEGTGPSSSCKKDKSGDIVNPYYGDCLVKEDINVLTDCDQIKTSSVQIFERSKKEEKTLPVQKAVGLAVYNENKEATTFSIKPIKLLGSDKEDTWYRVNLTSDITKANGDGAFTNIFNSTYSWEFETGVTVDLTAPRVVSVSPQFDRTISRNIILQITFDEPIDPAVAQGDVGSATQYNHIIFKDKKVTGKWKAVNGFRTLEFTSDQTCGQNSCGETMFCLPATTCNDKDQSCVHKESILIRSAELMQTGQQTFDAKPFSGIADMAGNALDGNKNGKPDGRPAIKNAKEIGESEIKATTDNVVWNFNVLNNIDLSVPHIQEVTPDLDAQGVTGQSPVEILFSMPMQYSSLFKGLRIEEYPTIQDENGDEIVFWNTLIANEVAPDTGRSKTKATILHRDFSPNGEDLFYFVSASSTVKGINGNCLYPGRGPKTNETSCVYKKGEQDNCLPADGYTKGGAADNDTGCAILGGSFDSTQPDVAACVKEMKKDVDALLKNLDL